MVKWYEHATDVARFRRIQDPRYANVIIGTNPTDGMTRETADKFDVFLNVSDTPCALLHPSRPDQRQHWLPLIECGEWPYGVLHASRVILDDAHERRLRVYLHCHAGAFRSPHILVAWLLTRGHTLAEACVIESSHDWSEKFMRTIDNGVLPSGFWEFQAAQACMPYDSTSDLVCAADPGSIQHLTKLYQADEQGEEQ